MRLQKIKGRNGTDLLAAGHGVCSGILNERAFLLRHSFHYKPRRGNFIYFFDFMNNKKIASGLHQCCL